MKDKLWESTDLLLLESQLRGAYEWYEKSLRVREHHYNGYKKAKHDCREALKEKKKQEHRLKKLEQEMKRTQKLLDDEKLHETVCQTNHSNALEFLVREIRRLNNA